MKDRGYSLPEILVSLALLALLLGAAAPLFASLEQLHRENQAYLEALQWMAQQVEEWRHGKVLEDGVDRVGKMRMERKVRVDQAGEAVERGEFTFTWRYGEKEWRVRWVVDRYRLPGGEGIEGAK